MNTTARRFLVACMCLAVVTLHPTALCQQQRQQQQQKQTFVRLASGAWDNSIKVWDMLSGLCLATLTGHRNCVAAVEALGVDELASSSYDGTIKIWRLDSTSSSSGTGHCVRTLADAHHGQSVFALKALSRRRLASGAYDFQVRVWNVTSGECLRVLYGHSDNVKALERLGDERLASASWDRNVRVWDLVSGECLHTLSGHFNFVNALQALATHGGDGRLLLASASDDRTVKIWDVESGQCVRTLSAHSHWVRSLALVGNGADETLLATGSFDNTIRVWNVTSGECVRTIERAHVDNVVSLVALQQQQSAAGSGQPMFASGSYDTLVKVWQVSADASKGVECVRTLSGHSSMVSSLVLLSSTLV